MNANDKTPKPQFSDGETVLCYHGPLLYEAKCIKSDFKNKSPQYLIHYSGWNKSWDEWVPCPRVLKFSQENIKKQQELLATHGTNKIITKIKSNSRKSVMNISSLSSGDAEKSDEKLSTGRSTSVSSVNTPTSINESKKKKQKVEDSLEQTEDYVIKNEIHIEIPYDLKLILNEDYENVCINNKLAGLPVNKTITSILDEYVTYKLEKKNDKNVITEIVEALKDYFNTTITTKLLYKSEREQYIEIIKSSKKTPCDLFGSVHFLRLFVKIGHLLSYTFWDEICIKQITLHIEDVLRFLSENKDELFNSKNVKNIGHNKSIKEDK